MGINHGAGTEWHPDADRGADTDPGINQGAAAAQHPGTEQAGGLNGRTGTVPRTVTLPAMNPAPDVSFEASRTSTAYTLVFFTAAWCDPAIPMRVIFDETLRDLARLRPAVQVTGVVIDVDDEENLRKEGQRGAPAVSDELLDSIDMLPTIVLLTDAGERDRFVGQLPKLTIRERVLAILDA